MLNTEQVCPRGLQFEGSRFAAFTRTNLFSLPPLNYGPEMKTISEASFSSLQAYQLALIHVTIWITLLTSKLFAKPNH